MSAKILQACSFSRHRPRNRTVIILYSNHSFIGLAYFYGYKDRDSMSLCGSNYLWVIYMTIKTSKFRASKLLLGSVSAAAIMLAFTPTVLAQTVINDAQTTPVETDGEDVTIETGGSITLEDAGPALTLNSDNSINNAGAITITDVDGATGVLLEGGANRGYVQSGTINLSEDFTQEDVDGDFLADGAFAEGSGRTGILISGASPFEGNIELTSTSFILVEGNDSFGINLENTSMAQNGLTGNLSYDGQISVTGDNATGINIGSGISGDFAQNGSIATAGLGAQAINIDADIQGGFVSSGSIVNTGFRSTQRLPVANEDFGTGGRDTLMTEDLLQAGAAIGISGNIDGGIFIDDGFDPFLDEDGNQTFDEDGNLIQTFGSEGSIAQFGSAPAILIDGEGTPIAIGRVGAITDPTADGFDADLQYAFVNQGTLQANGVNNDFDATTFSVADATLTGGINNTGSLTASAFVAPFERTEGDDPNGASLTPGDGHARVIVIGPNAIAERINNSGIILATSSEDADLVFANPDSPTAPTSVLATAIDIDASAGLTSITNSNVISAVLIGRSGEAIAIQDRSGTLTSLTNTGNISALGTTSDASGESTLNFSLIALDASQNVSGFTFTQNRAADTDPDDDVTPADPLTFGNILLGSGDDNLTATAGLISGDVDFAAGNDTLALSGGSTLRGALTNQGGLDISVIDNSTLALTTVNDVPITSASFDGTATFSPTLDGSNGQASTLVSTGDISFDSGATIAPTLTNVFGINQSSFTVAQAGGALSVGELATLASGDSPFLFNSSFDVVGNDLVITLDLRNAEELGLDQVQSLAFAPTIEALQSNTALGDAFANITSQSDFNAAYNQILPEFSAAARQFVLANVDGATGAVANHLDSVRRSPDKPGGAWLQEFAYFADRDLAGLSEQFRGHGFGFSAGLDTAFGPFHAVGVNLGFASTEIEDVVGIDEPLDVVTIQGGAYAGWASGNLGVEAYAGGGYNDFEQNRNIRINTFSGSAQGDWSGTHINGSIRAGYDVELNDKFWFRPTVSLDYLRLSEDAFTETGDAGVALDVDSRTSETGSATAMFNFGAKFEGKRTWIRPSLRAGYRQEFLNDPVNTSFRFTGLTDGTGQTFNSETADLQALLFPDSGFVLGFSVAAGSAFSSIGFDFDSDIRDGFIRHTGRVVVRLLF